MLEEQEHNENKSVKTHTNDKTENTFLFIISPPLSYCITPVGRKSSELRPLIVIYTYDYINADTEKIIGSHHAKQYDANRNRKKTGHFAAVCFALCQGG